MSTSTLLRDSCTILLGISTVDCTCQYFYKSYDVPNIHCIARRLRYHFSCLVSALDVSVPLRAILAFLSFMYHHLPNCIIGSRYLLDRHNTSLVSTRQPHTGLSLLILFRMSSIHFYFSLFHAELALLSFHAGHVACSGVEKRVLEGDLLVAWFQCVWMSY